MTGFRTLIFNALAMIVPVLELTEVRDVLPDEWLPWYGLILALANMYLRGITTTPVTMGKDDLGGPFESMVMRDSRGPWWISVAAIVAMLMVLLLFAWVEL